jgi:pimeloyl-ACP methyl ester carboxylesterase
MPVTAIPDHTRHGTIVKGEDLTQVVHPGTGIETRNVAVDGHVSIRTIRFTPRAPGLGRRPPIVLVSGLSTVIESFKGVLVGLTETHTVVYVETREKPSSHISGKAGFDLDGFAADVEAAVSAHGFGTDGYVLIGYSLGAAAIMHGFAGLSRKPLCVILAEPTPVFRIPRWAIPLAHIGVPFFPAVRSFALWYMRNFKIDTEGDEEIMNIVRRALGSADPVKLRNTIASIAGRDMWDKLPLIDRPTLVVATSRDTLHEHSDIVRMGELLPDAELVDMEDNTRTHSAEMAQVAGDYLDRVTSMRKGRETPHPNQNQKNEDRWRT